MKTLAPLVLAVFALPLHAAPSIGMATVTPRTAIVGTATQVTVTASITDSSLIQGSVNLVQLNANGTTTILGTLHDDGLNGDAHAGDGVLTLLATFNATSPGTIQIQVSAAFEGILQRVKGPVMSVLFQPANAPQQSITALAQNLAAGNTTAAMSFLVPSEAPRIGGLNQQGLNVLASMLQSGVLVRSENDLRIFRAPFVTPSGTTTTVEFTMVPGPSGQWLINSW
jgi:hypothetical protein